MQLTPVRLDSLFNAVQDLLSAAVLTQDPGPPQKAAQAFDRATSGRQDPRPSLPEALVNLRVSVDNVRAQTQVLRVQDETLGDLVDLLA